MLVLASRLQLRLMECHCGLRNFALHLHRISSCVFSKIQWRCERFTEENSEAVTRVHAGLYGSQVIRIHDNHAVYS